MSFQILNKEGVAVPIKQLDVEAAKFWGKEVDLKWYADPSPKDTDVFKRKTNWFDTIGYIIHNPEVEYTKGWDNVKCSLWVLHTQNLYNKSLEVIKDMAEYLMQEHLKPYYDLIDHWEAKGYQPKQIKE